MTTYKSLNCTWCDRFVSFSQQNGWIHVDGGAYVEYCECGWSDTTLGGFSKCQKCSNTLIRHSHRASPQISKGV